jgi:tetratricopeptide (TPR) repeat protein
MRTNPAFAALFIFLLVSAPADSAFGGEFEGLQPGVSRKADADRVLGAPIRELIPGEQYDYDPSKHDSRRISIRYYRDTQVVQTIDLYLAAVYPKETYKGWFNLGTPTKTESDANGRFVEYYAPEGLALHYTGPDVNSGVEFFSHYDLRMPAQTPPTQAARIEPRPAAPVQPLTPALQSQPAESAAPSKLRLGAVISVHDGQGLRIFDVAAASPAARAGLKSGDVILEFGNTGLYETRILPARINGLLAGHQPGQSIRLLVQRGTERFETAITPEERASIDPKQAELAKAAYDQGRKLMEVGDFVGAAKYFNQAISLDPSQPAGYSSLAESFYRRRNPSGEIEALKRGVIAAPGYRLYGLLGFACRRAERWDEAINAFGKAIALMPDQAKDLALYEAYAFCLVKKRRYGEALSPLESVHKINPRSPAAVYLLGACHDALKNRDQAMKFYREYLGLGDSDKNRVKYANRRLDILTKGSQATRDSAKQLIDMLEPVVKEATKPD